MTTKIFSHIFGYTDSVLRYKPSRSLDTDLRDLPTYTIPEVALFLGMPKRTISYWFSPENKILQPSLRRNEIALLSFRDLSEAYVLTVLTRFYDFRMSRLRSIIANAKTETRLERPLIQADLKVLFTSLIIEKPARGRRPRQMVDIAHPGRNLVFPEFVDQLGKRILRDSANAPLRIYPWRLMRQDQISRPVSIDPEVLSGRLVVTGTRIPVRVLMGKKLTGKSVKEIAELYSLSETAVQKALDHFDRPLHKKAA